jgi:hypothetical protein
VVGKQKTINRPRSRWEDNRITDLKGIGLESFQGRDKWRLLWTRSWTAEVSELWWSFDYLSGSELLQEASAWCSVTCWTYEWVWTDCWNDTERPVPLPLLPPQVLHALAGERTCAFLVEGRRHGQSRFRRRPPWTAYYVGTKAFANERMSACRVFEINGWVRAYIFTAEPLFGSWHYLSWQRNWQLFMVPGRSVPAADTGRTGGEQYTAYSKKKEG